ncbi:MAG: hypothetical protein D3906_09500 [Candidatus Electrothrix sp. AUS1_2]|nr:hypothetical protein [Candidatus Electrothrix sp. AUS1_2]
MNTLTPDRGQLIEAINKLPLDVLPELADYLAYLQFKIKSVAKPEKKKQKSEFLLSIAGLGEAEEDLSERDEEILSEEIDPIRGWSLNREEQA